MKALCLIRAARMLERMPEADAAKHFAAHRKFTAVTDESRHAVGPSRLPLPDATTTLRLPQGSLSITDGPYAETKEHLGG